MSLGAVITLIVSVAVGGLRFVLPVSGGVNKADIYKDMAHLWVGGLIGAAIGFGSWWPFGWMAVGLTVLEVAAFVIRRRK